MVTTGLDRHPWLTTQPVSGCWSNAHLNFSQWVYERRSLETFFLEKVRHNSVLYLLGLFICMHSLFHATYLTEAEQREDRTRTRRSREEILGWFCCSRMIERIKGREFWWWNSGEEREETRSMLIFLRPFSGAFWGGQQWSKKMNFLCAWFLLREFY